MTRHKEPILAGFLSLVIPGLGQFYNEQLMKGIFIILILLLSLFFMVANVIPFPQPFMAGFGGMDWVPGAGWDNPFHFAGVRPSPLYRLFWILVIIPLIYIIAIADAVLSARSMNLNLAATGPNGPLGGSTFMNTEPYNTQNTTQDQLRAQAQTIMGGPQMTMGGPGPNPGPNPGYTSGSTPPPNPPYQAASPRRCGRLAVSGRTLLGLILLFVGFIGFMDAMNLDDRVFNLWVWNRLWPLIPLLFGMRLLMDYQRTRDRGRMVLGIVFAFLGCLFLVENWFNPNWDWVEDFWWVLFVAFGALLVFQDQIKRNRTPRA